MVGTLINVAAILLGTVIGLCARKGIPQRLQDTVVQGQGLCVILIGLSGALKTADVTGMIICMVTGGLLGAWMNIEGRLNHLGGFLERKLTPEGAPSGTIAKGFVTASLVYCVGAMAIVGALDSGLRGDHSTLISKSVLDGVMSIFFASSLGIGVGLSAASVLIYQGIFALLGMWLEPILTPEIINEMSAIGGLLIAGIGLNLIYEKHIPVGNLLPAIFLPMAYLPIRALFG